MIIYKITNIVNNKVYVGQTVKSVSIRRSEHVSEAIRRNGDGLLGKAIRKYGKEKFLIEPIDSASSKEELDRKEQEWIVKLNSHVSNGGYNLAIGGSSRAGWKEDPSKTAIRIAKRYKAVICLETREVFQSIKEAANKIGVSAGFMGKVVKGSKPSAKGLHFQYNKVE